MAVYDPPTVGIGSPVLASGLDALLRAADERLARLFGGRSWLMYNTTSVPSWQIPPWGAVYILSDDADRTLLPPPGSPGCPHGGTWPEQYNHAAHVAEAAALTITGPDPANVAWEATGTYTVDVYTWGDAASVLEGVVSSESRPLKLDGAFEAERFHRYALADVLIDSAGDSSFAWPHDKYGVVRIHNLSEIAVSVDLGGGQSIELQPGRIRCIRRTSRTGPWVLTERLYFPVALPGDIPMWDGSTTHMTNLPLRSQQANPIYRQAILQSMFRPHALTADPGMFSSAILPVLPSVSTGQPLSAAMIQPGEFEVIRTSTGDDEVADRFTLLYSGESLTSTPSAWAAVGLQVSLDDDTRGAVLEADPTFPGPESGTWHYDLISRTTNVTGGIVVPVKSGSVTERVLLPWFATATAADEWYSALFLWPTYGVTRIYASGGWAYGLWTPRGYGSDADYWGDWSQDGDTIEVREYVAEWDGASYGTVSAWNVFTKAIGDALPAGGTLIRQPLLTAVMTTASAQLWWEREDETWDDETAVVMRETEYFDTRHLYVAGQAWGMGSVSGDELEEPRWQLALWPTIGAHPTATWSAFPFYGSEEWIWTPLVPGDTAPSNLYHWRLQSPEGAAAGADWSWHYGTGGHTPAGDEPSGEVPSGMSFWRMFAAEAPQPGSAEPYPGRPETGPHPWPIRDHGWMADRILEGHPIAAGDHWWQGRNDCWDNVEIGGSVEIRPDEFHVGMQLRMCAAVYNQISALIRGMDHVRPLGWEQYVRGWSFNDLYGTMGWGIGLGSSGPFLQPLGAVHIYGIDTGVDARLDALGISRRSATSSELQALQTIDVQEYYVVTDLITGVSLYADNQTGIRTGDWYDTGDTIQYCTADDIHDAISPMGFRFDLVRFVQPVEIETLIAGPGIETVVDSFSRSPTPPPPYDNAPAGPYRNRISRTRAVPIPADAELAELQISASSTFQLAAERPMRSQIVCRDAGSAITNVCRVGPSSGPVADALDRFYGEFLCNVHPQVSVQKLVWWHGLLLGRSGLTVKVLAIPWRCLLSVDRSADETGPRAVTDTEWDRELVLPSAEARPKWLTVTTGQTITFEALAGGTPTWPDDHHVWELLPMDGSLEEM